jgi:NADP-dependent alcohol dehydrogenase
VLKDRQVSEFGGIEPNPTIETLSKAVAQARTQRIDFLLAVGGGSVLDGTKLIAAAIPFAGDPWDILAKQAPITAAVPLGAVLTLPATGSEMNGASVVSRAATHEKLHFISPLVMPRFSVLDPLTTRSLPPRQVGNGIVDAFVHVCEQYLTVRSGAALQDRQAEGILRTLIEYGPRAVVERDNEEVLGAVMWSATNALNGLIGVGVPQDWATHMIGHEITALRGLDHAQTLAVVLPTLLDHQRAVKRAKLVQYAERVWDLHDGDADTRITTAIARTRAFFESVGVPTRLSAYQVSPEIADEIAARLAARSMVLGETQAITPDVARAIVRQCG